MGPRFLRHRLPCCLTPIRGARISVNAITTPEIFDQYGRCLPAGLKSPAHHEVRRWFLFRQPAIDYVQIYARTVAHLCGSKTPATDVAEFAARAKTAFKRLQADPQLANVTRGIGIPFLLPQDRVTDHGAALESKYIPAVASSFKATLPEYDFTSHNPVHLAGQLSVADGSRHQRLLDAAASSDVVGWFFPCLLEYSVPAAREAIAALSNEFLLAGGIDTCAALVGTPDLFLRSDGYPPLIWLSGLEGEKEGIGYHFEAYGYNLTFNRRPHLGQVAEYWSNALVVLG